MYMKKNFILAVFCLIISAMAFAQAPQMMSYQAVVRGSDNNLVINQQIAMRVSILQGSADGTAVYTEIHSAQTNANGLVTIQIGDGASSDDFTAINWANGPYFVKTETDVNGGDNYDIVGVSQLLSVPYAMYAQTAGNIPDVSGFLTTETDPTVPDWAKAENKPVYNYSEIEGTPEIPTVPTNVSAFDNDANYVVNEADPTVPAWAKAETKPVYNYSEIEGTPEIPTVPTNVSAFDNDANYLTEESDPTVPAWAKADTKPVYNYSEIEGTPEIPTVPTNVSAFDNDANYLTSETDPTVPDWAKSETKPTYDYTEIQNTPNIPNIPNTVSSFENDANYLTSETDPTVPSWAKANSKPTYQYSEIQNTPDISVYLTTETDPTISDWAKADTKPTYNYAEIQNAPTAVSSFENDANYISTETQTLADVIVLGNSAGNNQIKNVANPTDAQDAATKKYIDDIVAPILAQNARMQATVDSLNYVLSLNAHEYVDLGLPSGTKWATCNVGATTPEGYGNYYAWGETTSKNIYSWSNYRYCNGSSRTLTKYCNNSSYGNNGFTDALTTLEASDDAATANWGSAWRMPTKEEFEELNSNCTVTWTTQNGVYGRLFTSNINGNSIFLPAAGYRNGSELYDDGSYGDYWSSSLYSDNTGFAWYLYFYSGDYRMYSYGYRYYGLTVRAVCQSQN